MGREAVKAVQKEADLELVGAVDQVKVGEDAGIVAGIAPLGVVIADDLARILREVQPDVVLDLSNVTAVKQNVLLAIQHKVCIIVGATGLNADDLAEINALQRQYGSGVAIIPNFAIGAVLMMQFAQMAAKFFPDVEIIELHHNQKIDAPSGTALKTAEMIAAARQQQPNRLGCEKEKVVGTRGGLYRDVNIHSVRLPGYVAHQEVIFGGLGQALTIRHDSFNREAFMPGVVLALRRAKQINGVVYGLERLLEM